MLKVARVKSCVKDIVESSNFVSSLTSLKNLPWERLLHRYQLLQWPPVEKPQHKYTGAETSTANSRHSNKGSTKTMTPRSTVTKKGVLIWNSSQKQTSTYPVNPIIATEVINIISPSTKTTLVRSFHVRPTNLYTGSDALCFKLAVFVGEVFGLVCLIGTYYP